jgi:hypothetical protein
MQVSATLIAAQQAAREARARLQMPQAAAPKGPSFTAALEQAAPASQAFSALPLKQTAAAPQAAAQPQAPQAGARLGQYVNIVV